MILQGKNSYGYWKDSQTKRVEEDIYSWKDIFGMNPLSLIVPYEKKQKSQKFTQHLHRTG